MGVDRSLVWLHGEVKTPPLSAEGRILAGTLLRRLQRGETLGMPHSRPMPQISARCHELRIRDEGKGWRIVYGLTGDAVVVLDVFRKTTRQTPHLRIEECRRRWRLYLAASRQEG